MAEITAEDLKRLLREVAGVDENVDMNGEGVEDKAFADLGYDSLALLEFTNRIEQDYGIQIPDGDLEHSHCLREAVDYVNDRLAKAEL
ncbi:acyl carrier protein [Actinomadura sp. 3N508]|uniref:acyl carrier protein n=1 Tax=Actinomadura sp. 3N508 TaxID=3375153 RepID=UPI0037B30AB7